MLLQEHRGKSDTKVAKRKDARSLKPQNIINNMATTQKGLGKVYFRLSLELDLQTTKSLTEINKNFVF